MENYFSDYMFVFVKETARDIFVVVVGNMLDLDR